GTAPVIIVRTQPSGRSELDRGCIPRRCAGPFARPPRRAACRRVLRPVRAGTAAAGRPGAVGGLPRGVDRAATCVAAAGDACLYRVGRPGLVRHREGRGHGGAGRAACLTWRSPACLSSLVTSGPPRTRPGPTVGPADVRLRPMIGFAYTSYPSGVDEK